MKNVFKIYILAIICFFVSTSEYVIVGVLDKIALSTGISISAAGQLITVFAISSAIGTPLIIMYTTKLDRRILAMASIFLVSLGSFFMIISPNYNLLLLSRIILAIGTGVFNVTCYTIAAKLSKPERRARTISIIIAGFNAALIFGLPMGRFLTSAFGWKSIFWSTGIFSLLSIFIIGFTIPSIKEEKSIPIKDQLALLKNPRILLILGITFFWLSGYSVTYSYITPFLKTISSMSEQTISLALLLFGVSTLIGSRSGGILADKFGIKISLISSLAVHSITLLLISIIAGSINITIVLLILWAISSWTTGPIQQNNIISQAPEASGTIISFNASITQFAFATGSAIGGIAIEKISIFSISWIGSILVAVSVLITFIVFKKSSSCVCINKSCDC